MFDLKPYGAFIENTIRPLLEEVRILGLQNIDINKAIKKATILHVVGAVVEAIKTIVCTAIIGYVAYRISWKT